MCHYICVMMVFISLLNKQYDVSLMSFAREAKSYNYKAQFASRLALACILTFPGLQGVMSKMWDSFFKA